MDPYSQAQLNCCCSILLAVLSAHGAGVLGTSQLTARGETMQKEKDTQMEELISRLFACSRLHEEEEGRDGLNQEKPGEAYISRENYLDADSGSRRKLREFAIHFDPGLFQSIQEWERGGSDTGYSRIDTRARLIMLSGYRHLRGHR
ncbi:MAG: hypothetical protein LLG06_01165 [Desulfobacteraceae bacterium]|nr:hypothetical protein [Desulfobacteraceae bacterium]